MPDDTQHAVAIVVPCYNEAARLDPRAFQRFAAAHPELRFILVDDGSRDATRARLSELARAAPASFSLLALPDNRGKAEAVRAGMVRAFEQGCELAGYWDADLATPLDEIPRFVATLRERPQVLVVFGARVQLLGRTIERSAARHYLGRVFATAASTLLGLPVYDTQCGAKLFRATAFTRELFSEPFLAGWAFDVEILARLVHNQAELGGPSAAELVYELPLRRWHDVKGSKVVPADFARGLLALGRIRARYLQGLRGLQGRRDRRRPGSPA